MTVVATLTDTPLIEALSISKRFVKSLGLVEKVLNAFGGRHRAEIVRAVDDIDLSVLQGEVVGLVGESGCGKSTLGRIIAGVLAPSSGTILHRGVPREKLGRAAAKETSLRTQMIFQDPFSSINPRMRIGDVITEAPRVHGIVAAADLDGYLDDIMQRCGLDPKVKSRYSYQFSGGQRQRIVIARALAVKPAFLVCDEPVAALDVSIQAQIINLFMQLRDDLRLTYLFISHDLGVIRHVSDRVVIMYLGRFVETAPAAELFAAPNHPYTQALLSEVPRIDKRHRVFAPVEGRNSLTAGAAFGLPFPPALPSCHGALHVRAARSQEDRRQSSLRMPSQ